MPMLHEQLTSRILEACFETVNEIGSGFVDPVYHNALLIVLRQKGVSVHSQVPLSVSFRGEIVGQFVSCVSCPSLFRPFAAGGATEQG